MWLMGISNLMFAFECECEYGPTTNEEVCTALDAQFMTCLYITSFVDMHSGKCCRANRI